MGNRIGKICLCSTSAGDISGRHQNPFGNSICYIRPPYPFFDGEVTHVTTFRSLSGASVSANSSTPPSTVSTTTTTNVALDSSASFESSPSFTSSPMPLQLYRHTSRAGSSAGSCSAVWCSPTERGFSSQKLQRRFSYGLENKPRKQNLKNILKRVISTSIVVTGLVSNRIYNNKKNKEKVKDNAFVNAELGCGLDDDDDDDKYLDDEGGLFCMGSENLQWAQGRAGEDRLHIVISEENGWVFVGIYDGFNGPDATDYLLDNLFFAVYDELKVLLNLDAVSKMNSRNSSCESEEDAKSALAFGHSDVLLALSEALRKTEDAFLKGVDEMISDNSVLAMMGSCVLVMLMKGQDVYLMNVGDSRAVLATDHSAKPVQLTMEHSTLVKEEVHRIRKEHLDDPSAITKGRVKGYLNVTRAFGVGFLKQPKQNNAILEAFKVNYIGESPYITCCPSLYHHRLNPSDRFLILCSDGLHQYFTNEEAVAKVESFFTLSPDMDPAQLLIKEALSRAAKKAGMDFHELLEIPQGERRHYHDDISIVIISFEGNIWRSSV